MFVSRMFLSSSVVVMETQPMVNSCVSAKLQNFCSHQCTHELHFSKSCGHLIQCDDSGLDPCCKRHHGQKDRTVQDDDVSEVGLRTVIAAAIWATQCIRTAACNSQAYWPRPSGITGHASQESYRKKSCFRSI